MHIIFSHGKESGPWGSKISQLSECAQALGFSTESIDYQHTMNPDERVAILAECLKQQDQPTLLVGSSMGGYTAICNAAHAQVKGVFLLAPALFIEGYQQQHYSANVPVTTVHGWDDDIIPYQNSVTFAAQSNTTLHLIAGDHRLNSSLKQVITLFNSFLQSFTAKA